MEHFKTSYDAASQYARQISRKLQQNFDDDGKVDNEIISDVLKLAKRVSTKCGQTARYGRRQSIQAFRMLTDLDPYSRQQSFTAENSQREPKRKARNVKHTDSEPKNKHLSETDHSSDELFSRVNSPDNIEAYVPTRYQQQQQHQQQQQQEQRQLQLPPLQLPPPPSPLPQPLPQPLLPWTSSGPQPLPQHQTPYSHTSPTPMSLFDYPPPPPPHALLHPISSHPPPPPPVLQQLPLSLPMTQNPPDTPQTMPPPETQTHYHIHNTHNPTLSLPPRSEKQVQFPMESTATHQTSPDRQQQVCCSAPHTTITITHEETPGMTCNTSCQQKNVAAEKTQTATVSSPACCVSSSKLNASRAPTSLPGRCCLEKAVYRKLFDLVTHHETNKKCGDSLRHSPCTTSHTTPGLGSGCSCVIPRVCEDHHHNCDMITNIHQCRSSRCYQEAAPPMAPHHHPDQRSPTCMSMPCPCPRDKLEEPLTGCRQHTTCCESCQKKTTEDSNALFEHQQQQKCFPGITNKGNSGDISVTKWMDVISVLPFIRFVLVRLCRFNLPGSPTCN